MSRDADESIPQPKDMHAHDLGGGAVLLVHDVARDAPLPDALSPAQRDVVGHALRGFSDEDIARATGRSRHTVSNLLRQAFARLGVASRTELAARLRESSLDDGDRNDTR